MLNAGNTLPGVTRQVNAALLSPKPLEYFYQTDDELSLALYAEKVVPDMKALRMLAEKRNSCVDLSNETPKAAFLSQRVTISYKTRLYPFEKDSCVRCGSKDSIEMHHITYRKVEGLSYNIVPLCKFCHARITGLNTRATHLYMPYRKLTDEQRVFLFHKVFMKTDWNKKKRLSKKEIEKVLVDAGLFSPYGSTVLHVGKSL